MPKKVSKNYHKNVNAKDIRVWKKWQKRTKIVTATLLVLAIAGGSYWAYKSFAATASYTYTVNNGILHAVAPGSAVAPGETNKGKAGEQVVIVQPGGQVLVSGPQNGVIVPAGQRFQMCVVEKGADLRSRPVPYALEVNFSPASHTNNLSPPLDYGDQYDTSHESYKLDLNNGYSEVCGVILGKGTQGTPFQLLGPITLNYHGSAPMYLSSFTIKLVN